MIKLDSKPVWPAWWNQAKVYKKLLQKLGFAYVQILISGFKLAACDITLFATFIVRFYLKIEIDIMWPKN